MDFLLIDLIVGIAGLSTFPLLGTSTMEIHRINPEVLSECSLLEIRLYLVRLV